MRIKPGQQVLLVNPPANFHEVLGNLPEGVTLQREPKSGMDVILCFMTTRAQMEQQLTKLKGLLADKGSLWIAYPKGTSRLKSELNRDLLAEFAATAGLKAIFIISIDDTWSGLRMLQN